MEEEKVIANLKSDTGNFYRIHQELDLLGECQSEENIFYSGKGDNFYLQKIDWNNFNASSWKRTITFQKLNDREAFKLVVESLKSKNGLNDK